MDEQMDIPEFTDADKRESVFHDFDKTPEVVGKLRSIEEGTYGKQYIIDTPNGDVVLGTYDVLKSKIQESDVGKWIKVICKGNEVSAKTKRTYKNFEIFIK